MKLLGAAAWWSPISRRPAPQAVVAPLAPSRPAAPVAVFGADLPAVQS
jgi:hypothetical protein